jgi:hypothetical protein
MITGDEFTASGLRVEESVYETIIRLEEVKHGLRKAKDEEIREALDLLKARWLWGKGFLRTSFDRKLTGGYKTENGERIKSSYVKLPTGEPKYNFYSAYSYQILSWEKDRNTINETRKYFLEAYPGPYNWSTRALKDERVAKRQLPRRYGYHCCGSCNTFYQKTLKLSDPEFYYDKEKHFLDNLEERRTKKGRWRNYPFYYTILSLEEIGSEGTKKELKTVAKYVKPSLLKRYKKDDRASQFRRHALNTLLQYV